VNDRPTCDACGQPLTDNAHLCHACTGRLRSTLHRVDDATSELATTVARQGRISAGTGRSSNDERPLPYDINAATVADVLANTVTTWARHVAETRGLDPVLPLGRWLAGHVDWIRHHPWAADMLDEIDHAVDAAIRAVDRPRSRVYAGPCPVDDCGQDLYARPASAHATCTGCGTQHDVQARREWMLAAVEDVVDTASVVAATVTSLGTHVTAARVRQWAHRKRILAHSIDPNGRPRYLVRDVLTLARGHQRA
jgi:hypothetical protein